MKGYKCVLSTSTLYAMLIAVLIGGKDGDFHMFLNKFKNTTCKQYNLKT